ncbi:MAG: hypothetical protein J7578_20050 [Chitinophagaceae bacterium]|nr:hypothetical protein [Chitinophagaceae bacterium]
MRALILLAAIQVWAVLYSPASFATPPFSLANTIQSNMVLQQAKPFKVWGTAANGTIIEVQADWMQQPVRTSAAQQEWLTESGMNGWERSM